MAGPDSVRYTLSVAPERGYQIRFIDLSPAFNEVRIVEFRVLGSTTDRTILDCEVSGDQEVLSRFRKGD